MPHMAYNIFSDLGRAILLKSIILNKMRGILSMTRKITIDWLYPMDINNILVDSRMNDIGIYYITRNFGGKIVLFILGKQRCGTKN